MTDVPLFEQPDEQTVTLSDFFSTWEYRVVPDSKISYRKRSLTKFHPCEECAYLQHETYGRFGPKRAIKVRRVGPGPCARCPKSVKKHDTHIDLCNEHARLWKEQDGRDLKSDSV